MAGGGRSKAAGKTLLKSFKTLQNKWMKHYEFLKEAIEEFEISCGTISSIPTERDESSFYNWQHSWGCKASQYFLLWDLSLELRTGELRHAFQKTEESTSKRQKFYAPFALDELNTIYRNALKHCPDSEVLERYGNLLDCMDDTMLQELENRLKSCWDVNDCVRIEGADPNQILNLLSKTHNSPLLSLSRQCRGPTNCVCKARRRVESLEEVKSVYPEAVFRQAWKVLCAHGNDSSKENDGDPAFDNDDDHHIQEEALKGREIAIWFKKKKLKIVVPSASVLSGQLLIHTIEEQTSNSVWKSVLAFWQERTRFIIDTSSTTDVFTISPGEGISAIIDLETLYQKLCVSSNSTGSFHPAVANALPSLNCKDFISLRLSGQGLRKVHLLPLLKALKLESKTLITELDLSKNDLGGDVFHLLLREIESGSLRKLRSLNFTCCGLSDTELVSLLKSLSKHSISSIDLSFNEFGVAASNTWNEMFGDGCRQEYIYSYKNF